MSEKENTESLSKLLWSLLSIILSLFLFFSAFFIIYANELSISKNSKKTEIQKIEFYDKVFLWDYLKNVSDYKDSILIGSDNSENMTTWIIRFLWTFWLGFALTLFFIPIFSSEPKDKLSVKAFIVSIIIVPIFIIFLKLYKFYLSWWFLFDFSWLLSKNWWLSMLDKIFIIIVIIFIFVVLWLLYNYMKKKQDEKNSS